MWVVGSCKKEVGMRKFISLLLIVSVVLISIPCIAAQGRKGASDKAYEHASDEAIFHRVGDWFATRGKSGEEKKAIIAERKAKRAAARAQKKAEKEKRKLEKGAKKSQKKMKGFGK